MSDTIDNHSDNEHFQDVLKRSVASPSRRSVIRGGLGLAALSSVPFMAGCGGDDNETVAAPLPTPALTLGFTATAKSIADGVVLPAGYTFTVLHATGDRLVSSIPAYSNKGTETDDWSQRIGDHHDGMDIYFIGSDGKYTSTDTGRAVLAVNHESSADAHFFHPSGQTSNGVTGRKFDQFGTWDLGSRPALEVLKEINHHGVSLVEVIRSGSGWKYVVDSIYNRRVTAQTEVRVAGPAAHLNDIRSMMVTRYDRSGSTARGTLNNCGHGNTPWGSYLGCEQNWAVYFLMPKGSNPVDAKTIASRARYGVSRTPVATSATVAASQGCPVSRAYSSHSAASCRRGRMGPQEGCCRKKMASRMYA